MAITATIHQDCGRTFAGRGTARFESLARASRGGRSAIVNTLWIAVPPLGASAARRDSAPSARESPGSRDTGGLPPRDSVANDELHEETTFPRRFASGSPRS